MYCISRSANLTLPIRDRKVTYHPKSGEVIDVKPAVSVHFAHAGVIPDYAKAAVSALPDWGRGAGLNEDPFERCGSFDTVVAAEEQGWDKETLDAVETALRRISGVSFVIVDEPVVPAPWPNYDSMKGSDDEVAKRIAKKVSEDGYDPSEVAAYEEQGKNRQEVLDVLEILAQDSEPDTVGVIQA